MFASSSTCQNEQEQISNEISYPSLYNPWNLKHIYEKQMRATFWMLNDPVNVHYGELSIYKIQKWNACVLKYIKIVHLKYKKILLTIVFLLCTFHSSCWTVFLSVREVKLLTEYNSKRQQSCKIAVKSELLPWIDACFLLSDQ